MRSQATKPQPKKGALLKASFKQHSPTKQVKKKPVTSSKSVNTSLKKSVVKTVKKKKPTKPEIKNEESSEGDVSKPNTSKSDTSKSESGKSPVSTRSNSPAKKNKEKKVATKKPTGLLTKKKTMKKNTKLVKNQPVVEDDNDDSGDEVKYKINSEHVNIKKLKNVKTKVIPKTTSTGSVKKLETLPKLENSSLDSNPIENEIHVKKNSHSNIEPDILKPPHIQSSTNSAPVENKTPEMKTPEIKTNEIRNVASSPNIALPQSSILKDPQPSTPQKPKSDVDRPPKFFTSSRLPRIVDIDLKSCKTTKTNISLTEKFASMKTPDNKFEVGSENKAGEISGNTPKEPEIDVYTFTDYKVDSPKSTLPDFRSPMSKNIGRVRPIARVKGTVIDKNKSDIERKKYSPHRPIEEVVKQLKAGKRAEEARLLLALTDSKLDENKPNAGSTSVSGETGAPTEISESGDRPRNVVSKSYKMVARKSNIPGTTTVGLPPSITNVNDSSEDINKKPTKNTVKNSKLLQSKKTSNVKKLKNKIKQSKKKKIFDDDIDHSTFSLNTSSTSHAYSSSDESLSESNYDTKESSESEDSVGKKMQANRKKNKTSKELEALSSDSLTDMIGEDKPSKRRLKLLSMWTGPKKHRMASLNALAKVHCLYENESRTHSELGLMKTVERNIPTTSKSPTSKKKLSKSEKHDSTSESEYEKKDKMVLESSEEDTPPPSTRNLRVVPGSRGSGKYWDHKSSTSSSEESEADCRKQLQASDKRKPPSKPATPVKSDTEKPPAKMKKTVGVPIKKKRNRNEVVMDLKDMVVQKRMASLNATAILAASYEKRSPKSSKEETTTSDSCSDKDETYCKKSKNGVASGVPKSEAGIKIDECKKESESSTPKQKVEVIVNQDTDVTITGVYSHHEGFCTVSGLKYRISSTSHTQTTATASAEKEGCVHDDGSRYTPLSALSSMQPPPADPSSASTLPPHTHPAHEHRGLGLGRRPGCSSAFSAPPPTHQHHEPDNPQDIAKIGEVLFEQKKKVSEISPDNALALVTSLGLSKWQYGILRKSGIDEETNHLPSYQKILQAKKNCYPPKDDIVINENMAQIKLQSILDLTTKRILCVANLPANETNLVLVSKWGFDGASEQSMYNQRFRESQSESSFSDSSVFMTSLVPLKLVNNGQILWENPRPSSTHYCRPVKFQFVQESSIQTKLEMERMEKKSNLVPTQHNGKAIKHDLFLTMIDGKISSTITDTPTSTCNICEAKPSQMNNLEELSHRQLKTDFYKYGMSTLHLWIRCLECLLHISYNLDFKKWSAREEEHKCLRKTKKEQVAKDFRNKMGIIIDVVKQGVGTSNTGNVARTFFRYYSLSASITGLSESLILRIAVLLQAISSGKKVNVDKFDEYANETAQMYVSYYGWYYMPSSLHKLLVHGAKIIQHFSHTPIGKLSEEASEARNKDFRNIREHHTRKTGREHTNTDILHNLLVSSDPVISYIRPRYCKPTRLDMFPETLKLLIMEEEESESVEIEIYDNAEETQDPLELCEN